MLTRQTLCSIVLLCAYWAICTGSAAQTASASSATAPATKTAKTPGVTGACPAILQHQLSRLQDDSPQNLCQYAGQLVLVVNTASYCGFTSQYAGLERLYAKYKSKGLVVLGFPSNDFGKQEPGSAKEIADFCFNTYGVKFPMFSKTVVSGAGKSALYAALEKSTGKSPQWNFHKYLIDRTGNVVAHFPSEVEPESAQMLAAIDKALTSSASTVPIAPHPRQKI
jgi:glutathione peroxidase